MGGRGRLRSVAAPRVGDNAGSPSILSAPPMTFSSTPPVPDAADNAIEPGGVPQSRWPESTRPLEGRSSSFDITLLDASLPPPAALRQPAVFDVCHVGVVLRAMLFANGVMAVGVMFAADSLRA